MKIGVLGTGVVGQTIAHKLAELGHEVKIGTRDMQATMAKADPDGFGRPPFREWQRQNPGIELATLKGAAAFGEMLINAMNGAGCLQALELAGRSNLAGKSLLDISNPLDFSKGFPPSLSVSNTDSLAEQIQRAFPETRVVKSLNTMNAYIMVNPKLLPESHSVFLSGNDEGARQQVRALLREFGWDDEDIIDMGDITTARGSEQLLPIWTRLFNSSQNPMFNFKVVWGKRPEA